METVSYTLLKKLAKKDTEPKKRIAVIGDCATQQLATALRGESVRRDFPLSVLDADYDQMEAQGVCDGDIVSLYGFEYEYVK